MTDRPHAMAWGEDSKKEGWHLVMCGGCGWAVSSPDPQVVADSWGDHMYRVGFQDGWESGR